MSDHPEPKKINNISWRHHYVPEFYLRGFTNPEGTFKIYDVERSTFIRNGKDFSPESFFFEVDGNTFVTQQGEPDDFIEKGYSDLDNRVSKLFDTIRHSDVSTRFGVTEEDMPALQHCAGVMYWRTPSNYDQIKSLIQKYELHELGLILHSKTTNEAVRNEELEARIKNDPNFYKELKKMLPYLTYKRILDCRTPLTIQGFPAGFPAICSDNPIIFEQSTYPDIYFDDFIFPLSETLVFIRGNVLPEVSNHVKMMIDLISLKQAKKYVSCTDTRYIDALNILYAKNGASLETIKRYVFHTLIQKT